MDKFFTFLESLQTETNTSLLNAVKEAYCHIFESDEEEKKHRKVITFKFRNSEDSVKRILDMYKNKKRGVLLLDPDGDLNEPVTAFLIPECKPSDSKYGKYLTYDVHIYTKEDENLKECEIVIESNNKDRLDRAVDTFKKLFKDIGDIGNCGHSYGIKYVPNNNQGKIDTVGWDGDGSDYIDTKTIKVK